MINDCAYVGETILRFMSGDVEKVYVKRSRGFLSKTVGIAYKILRSRGDVYHVNYLLQDCYIASMFGKRPLIGHAHGSDLRVGLKHFLWKKIVRHNLKHCDKIFVSTPDILELAKTYREDVEYLPNPVDTQLFYPKPSLNRGEKLKVLIASNSDWDVKGTDTAIKALSRIKDRVDVSIVRYGKDFDKTVELAKSLDLTLHILEKTSHEKIREYYWKTNVVVDQFKMGSLGMISLEAIACGRPVITYVSSEYSEYRDFPLKDVNTEEEVAEAINNATFNLWKEQYGYLKKYHDPYKIADRVKKTYEALRNGAT